MIKKMAESEILKNYAGAIALFLGALPAIPSLTIGIINMVKGEPLAQKSWEMLRDNSNKHAELLNELTKRVEKYDSFMDGLQSRRLQAEVELLKKQIEDLKSGAISGSGSFYIGAKTSGTVGLGVKTDPEKVIVECTEGFVLDKGKCVKTPKSVRDVLLKQLEQNEKLKKEKMALEKARKELQQTQKAQEQRKPLQKAKPLPDSPEGF